MAFSSFIATLLTGESYGVRAWVAWRSCSTSPSTTSSLIPWSLWWSRSTSCFFRAITTPARYTCLLISCPVLYDTELLVRCNGRLPDRMTIQMESQMISLFDCRIERWSSCMGQQYIECWTTCVPDWQVLTMWYLTYTQATSVMWFVCLNSMIHTVMYTYYMFSAMGLRFSGKNFVRAQLKIVIRRSDKRGGSKPRGLTSGSTERWGRHAPRWTNQDRTVCVREFGAGPRSICEHQSNRDTEYFCCSGKIAQGMLSKIIWKLRVSICASFADVSHPPRTKVLFNFLADDATFREHLWTWRPAWSLLWP